MKITKELLDQARAALEQRRAQLEAAKAEFWSQAGVVALMEKIVSEEKEDGTVDGN